MLIGVDKHNSIYGAEWRGGTRREGSSSPEPPWRVGHRFGMRSYSEQQSFPVALRRPALHRGTSLIRNSAPLGPYSRSMHRVLWWP